MAEEIHTNWDGDLKQAFLEHYSDLYREAKRVLKNKLDAEDLIQDVFIKLSESEYEPEIRTKPKSYLLRVVRNASIDVLRSRKIRKKFKDLEEIEEVPAVAG